MLPRIAFCTTCKERLYHLRRTLPRNLADLDDYPNAVFIVLDYNSQDGLAEYIKTEHADALSDGRLVYYCNPEPDYFRMAHAKNMAHRCGILEGADILVNIDSDNWTGTGFAAHIARKFAEAKEDKEAVFLGTRANWRGPGELAQYRTPPGCAGRIVVSRDGFLCAGGYNEVFVGWTPDDKDFGIRLLDLGYSWRNIRPCFLHAIDHDQERRWNAPGEADGDFSHHRSHQSIVNYGRVGCGTVYRNFSSEPIVLDRIPTRIFGIGMHKTATTSLARALNILGYRCAHWEKSHWAKRIWDEMRMFGCSRTMEMHYALCDLPIPLLFKELDATYHGSKFILTLRNEDQWIESCRVHWAALRAGWDNDPFANTMHEAVYGTADFDEEVFRTRYRRHNADVLKHFRDRPGDLLVMDMSKGAGWPELCSFLHHSLVDAPFPHRHRTVEQQKYQDALIGLNQWQKQQRRRRRHRIARQRQEAQGDYGSTED